MKDSPEDAPIEMLGGRGGCHFYIRLSRFNLHVYIYIPTCILNAICRPKLQYVLTRGRGLRASCQSARDPTHLRSTASSLGIE